jgi:hypothetical protein
MNTYKQIYENNKDLLERVSKEKVECKYLKDEDVLLMTIGKKEISDSIDVDELMTVHYDPDTLKITGFTVPYVNEFIDCVERIMRARIKEEETLHPKPQSIASAGLFGLSLAY